MVLIALALAGCPRRSTPADSGPASPPGPSVEKSSPAAPDAKTGALTLRSKAFDGGQPIPKKYTGDGEDASPPLEWTGAPDAAKQFALIADDPDAPGREPWVHWVLFALPANVTKLPEALPRKPALDEPAGARQGVNSFPSNNVGYRGPAPPKGRGPHHYRFTLYALDAPIDLTGAVTKAKLLEAMQGHIVAQAELVGTYER